MVSKKFFVLVMCVLATVNTQDGHYDQFVYPSEYVANRGPRPPSYNSHRQREDYVPPLVRSPQNHVETNNNPEIIPTSSPAPPQEQYNNSTLKIPLDFIKNINQFSVNDLLLNFVEDDDEDIIGGPVIGSRFGEGEERSAINVPKAAGCAPELKTVKLKISDDPSVLYIPQCTRVQQCGGCCSHTLLSCQPNQTELLTFQVLKTQYNGNKKLKLVGKEPVVVEKHINCKCDCKVKAEHCNKYQEYRKSECRCACTNTDEEKKCYKNYAKKLWNPEVCACQCRDIFQCSSGYSFDSNDCKCVPSPIKRRYSADVVEELEYFPQVDYGS